MSLPTYSWSHGLALPDALQDKAILDKFITSNRQALRESYEHMTAWLKFHGVPYNPSQAGHFVMVNLRPFLDNDSLSRLIPQFTLDSGVMSMQDSPLGVGANGPSETRRRSGASLASVTGIGPETSFVEREEMLSNYWVESGVLVAKGTAYHMPEPGWYRCVCCISSSHVAV
jgi:1-aminocyclopropane-1-carboxylate synthase